MESETSKHRIAFGSCSDQDVQNNLWPVILNRKPAAFIWGGDAIICRFSPYADWSTSTHFRTPSVPTGSVKVLYWQLAVPGYRRLLDQKYHRVWNLCLCLHVYLCKSHFCELDTDGEIVVRMTPSPLPNSPLILFESCWPL
jgi:hypothetical protein